MCARTFVCVCVCEWMYVCVRARVCMCMCACECLCATAFGRACARALRVCVCVCVCVCERFGCMCVYSAYYVGTPEARRECIQDAHTHTHAHVQVEWKMPYREQRFCLSSRIFLKARNRYTASVPLDSSRQTETSQSIYFHVWYIDAPKAISLHIWEADTHT